MMTRLELIRAADRNGIIKWTRSGILEKVRLERNPPGKEPSVYARRALDDSKEHKINLGFGKFFCVEVKKSDLILAGDLLK